MVALVAHLLFLLLLPQPWRRNQSSDYIQYYEPVAQSLIAGNGFYLHSKPALTYPPGIPCSISCILAARSVDLSEANVLRIVGGFLLTVSACGAGLPSGDEILSLESCASGFRALVHLSVSLVADETAGCDEPVLSAFID